MKKMFNSANAFNQDISEWDTSNVTNMQSMFFFASSFNQDISEWDTSNVTNMQDMFYDADSFNRDISGWNVNSVKDMRSMFISANVFYQKNIQYWQVDSDALTSGMFSYPMTQVRNDKNVQAWYSPSPSWFNQPRP